MITKRFDGRQFDEIRPLKVTYNVFGYADGSVLFELGNTKVLCSVTLENSIPSFLKGKSEGWLTAEYALLPTSTQQRNPRDLLNKRNNRSIEISRLIGRSLRSIFASDKLIEKTINIDCDVLQADGGTRTASITGAYLALRAAETKWLSLGIIKDPILIDELASISAGFYKGEALLDLNFEEDSKADMDFNFVFTRTGKIIEMQGTAEKKPISWGDFEKISILAQKGINQTFSFFDKNLIISRKFKNPNAYSCDY